MIVKDLLIYDLAEKRAQKFEFAPGANIITADGTSVGKSCLLKSLFYGLGIQIGQFAQGWNFKKMIFKITYTHASKTGTIVRCEDRFYLDGAKTPLSLQEYARYLMKVVGIDLLLPLKDIGDLKTPYPSAILLPFYVDQDSSWSGVPYRDVVQDLRMYQSKAIPADIFRYYFGISNHELIQLQERKATLSQKHSKLNEKYSVLDEMQQDFVSKNVEISLINETELDNQIKDYLAQCSRLNERIIEHQTEILSLQQELDSKKVRLSEVEMILKETKTIAHKVSPKCTQCGSELTVEQSVKALTLENNKIALNLAGSQLVKAICNLEKDVSSKINDKSKIEQEQKRILGVLGQKQELRSLQEYISSAANSKTQEKYLGIMSRIDTSRRDTAREMRAVSSQIQKLKQSLKGREEEIGKRFSQLITGLSVSFPDIIDKNYLFLQFKMIGGSGNKRTEEFFCIYLSYLRLMAEYSQAQFPIGLDSVIKDETNEYNYKQIYPKIEDYVLNSKTQSFVVMLADKLEYISGKYRVIPLTRPILEESKYDEYSGEIETALGL